MPNTTDIKISWNGATKETSEKIMKGIDFDKAIQNVKEFIKYRDEHCANTGYFCRVTLQLTFMQNNMHELAAIVKLAASLGVDEVKADKKTLEKNIGKRLAARVLRTWVEDFVDEDTGEVVSLERNEVILERDTILDEANIALIQEM